MTRLILLAEDDVPTLEALAAYLYDAGYSVVPASTFEQAHRLLSFVRPDVVIADVRLGEYNGLQLVVHAGTLEPAPRVIVTSGYHDPVIESEARQMGATFLLKPLDLQRLLAVVDEATGRPW